MNKLCCLIILLFTYVVGKSQNLVLNGDFEQYSGCPNNVSLIDSALFWFSPQVPPHSDYHNKCNTTNFVGVPNNGKGYQPAHSGVGYAGLILRSTPGTDTREYIEVPLTAPLIANRCYHFEMHVNKCNFSKFTTDEISAYFSDTLVVGINNYDPLPFLPQVNNTTGFITDTLNWTLISGDFTAVGGERYLIIGNFKDDANTNVILIDSGIQYSSIYFYIDDVSLIQCKATSVNELNKNSEIYVYPNPFTSKVNITVKGSELIEVNLFDVTGRKLFNQSFTYSTSINLEHLAKGVYLYDVRNKNGVIQMGKLVKD